MRSFIDPPTTEGRNPEFSLNVPFRFFPRHCWLNLFTLPFFPEYLGNSVLSPRLTPVTNFCERPIDPVPYPLVLYIPEEGPLCSKDRSYHIARSILVFFHAVFSLLFILVEFICSVGCS